MLQAGMTGNPTKKILLVEKIRIFLREGHLQQSDRSFVLQTIHQQQQEFTPQGDRSNVLTVKA
jgi:hypothetical protein